MSDEQNPEIDDRDIIIAQQAERINRLELEVAALKALIEAKVDARKPRFR